MKLYFNPQSRALIAKWMLDECGARYDIVPIDLKAGEHKGPAFLAINPAGKLPALVDGEVTLFENAAICLYVADKFAEAKLAPTPDSPQRGRYLSLMVYSTSQLEPSMGDALMSLPTQDSRGWTPYETSRRIIEEQLADGPYLFGDWFTAADVMIGSMFIWKRRFAGTSDGAVLDAYVDRLLARTHAMKI